METPFAAGATSSNPLALKMRSWKWSIWEAPSPVSSGVLSVVGVGCSVQISMLVEAWKNRCIAQNHERPRTQQMFGPIRVLPHRVSPCFDRKIKNAFFEDGYNNAVATAPENKLQPALLNRKQVASYLGFSERTVHNMVVSGELPRPIKLPRDITRWRRSDIDQWLNGLSPRA
jgi:predicted DNA-binding transcriptional regulator AlpA